MTSPLMPKATAVWLFENTTLTFEQIAEFCGLHPLEVKGIADGEVAVGIVGIDPVTTGQLTRQEIARCEGDKKSRLELLKSTVPLPKARPTGARYTPVSRRQDRPDAIAWLIKFHPEIGDAQIQKLLGTTKSTIAAVRDRAHWNSPNIKARDPVSLGICSQAELDGAVMLAQKRKMSKVKRETAGRPGSAALEAPPSVHVPVNVAPPPPPAPEPAPQRAPTVESVFGAPRPDAGADKG
jgi:uncharacterized protein